MIDIISQFKVYETTGDTFVIFVSKNLFCSLASRYHATFHSTCFVVDQICLHYITKLRTKSRSVDTTFHVMVEPKLALCKFIGLQSYVSLVHCRINSQQSRLKRSDDFFKRICPMRESTMLKANFEAVPDYDYPYSVPLYCPRRVVLFFRPGHEYLYLLEAVCVPSVIYC